jgi:hypothetical protein
MVFTVVRSGFRARCALEIDDGGETRFSKICRIIGECKLGIHDISRTESDGNPPLPRFNMPLELGLFLGARHLGGRTHRQKRCVIFDRERYRYQRYISDIAGQDIHSHEDDPALLIEKVAAWLRDQSPGRIVPGGRAIGQEFHDFGLRLPAACAARDIHEDELTFGDLNALIAAYLSP